MMKSDPTSPESEVTLKQSLKNIKREFEEHKETLMKLKEERVSLVTDVEELKQTIKDIQESTHRSKDIQESTHRSKERAHELVHKNSKDIFSVVKSIAKALSVSKHTKDGSHVESLPPERPGTVTISHKKGVFSSASNLKPKRKLNSPLSSSEISSSTCSTPTEKNYPHQKTKVAFLTKGVTRKKKKKLSYSWIKDRKNGSKKTGNQDESGVKKNFDDLQKSE